MQSPQQKPANLLQRFLIKIASLYLFITALLLICFHYLLRWLISITTSKLDIHIVESLFLLIFTTLFVYILARYILTSQKLLTSLFIANAAPIVTSESKLFEKLLTTVDEGIVLSDSNNIITSVNHAFTKIMGYEPHEIVGQPGNFLRSGRHSESFYDELWRSMKNRGTWQGEVWVRRKNGEVFPEWLTFSTIKDSKGDITNYLTIFSDITERKVSLDRTHYLERYDPLTNLPNRAQVIDSITIHLQKARENNSKLALLYINLDFLKKINENYGYPTGDKLLQTLANKLKLHTRENETIGRLGGDEFMIVAPTNTNEEIIHLGKRVSEIISETIILEGEKYIITPSIGISVYPTDGDDVDMLIKDAATAMRKSKEDGRNNFKFFTHDMNNAAAEYQKIESYLKRGLEQNGFELYYHPMIDMKTNSICGAEALLRFRASANNFVSPQKFIPIAEESGLIIPITDWVLKTACQENLKWQALNINIPVSVNISALDFRQKNFKQRIDNILSETGLNPKNLKLEITESIMLNDYEETISTLWALKEMGISLSVDDFGTGYSSLNYLKKLPVDILKIDRSFVQHVVDDEDDQAIIRAIINIAKSLKLKVIAEGVENPKQLNFLREQHCDIFQGYYFSKPLLSEDFIKVIKAKNHF